MPCTLGPIRTRILPPSHLDCNVKGAVPLSPLSSPNKSSSTLQMLKACLWHQVGFGVVPSHKGKAFVLEIRHVEGEASASIGHGSERIIISGSWDLQIGTLRADDSHRVKSRCVPGDFLS